MTRLANSFEKDLMTTWLNLAGMGFCVLDNTSQIVSANRTFCQQLGLDEAQAIGAPVRGLFSGVQANAPFLAWLAGGVNTTADARSFDNERSLTIAQSGRTLHLLYKLSTVIYHTGDVFTVLSSTDITQLQNTRVQLEQNARRWQALNAGVVVSDAKAPDMPIVYVNRVFEEMSGYTAVEVIGKNCRFLQGNDAQPEAVGVLRHAISTGTNGYALLRNYRKNGTLFMNELFISPIRGNKGEITHFIGVQHLRQDGLAPQAPQSPLAHQEPAHADAIRAG